MSLEAGAPAVSQSPRDAWWRRALADPLTHFVLAGALLFGIYIVMEPERPEVNADPMRIELTPDDLRQISLVWLSQGRPTPSPEQIRNLAEQEAMQRILVQEAFALGLDKDDEIIARRLAQKMDFLLADLAGLTEPSMDELRDWYHDNQDRFTRPSRASFQHLYFSVDKRGEEGARNDASAAQADLSTLPEDTPVEGMADRFMFQNFYSTNTPEQVAREFGADFSDAVFELDTGIWEGPVRSGYGWHLVKINSTEVARVAAFDEIEPAIKAAWLDERYREIKQRAYDEMLSRYTIVIPSIEAADPQKTQLRDDETAPTPAMD